MRSSPAVVGGLVYVGSFDGNVYCLNAATGSLVWSYKTVNGAWSSPAVVDGVVYVGSDYAKIYAFGPSSMRASALPLILSVIEVVVAVIIIATLVFMTFRKRLSARFKYIMLTCYERRRARAATPNLHISYILVTSTLYNGSFAS